jgi:hypothetical protein
MLLVVVLHGRSAVHLPKFLGGLPEWLRHLLLLLLLQLLLQLRGSRCILSRVRNKLSTVTRHNVRLISHKPSVAADF